MKYVLFALALCLTVFSSGVDAKPKCFPKPFSDMKGNASYYKTGEMPDGVGWIAWTCTIKGKVILYDYAVLPEYKLAHPVPGPATESLSAVKLFEEYLKINTSRPLLPHERIQIAPARAAASAAFGLQ